MTKSLFAALQMAEGHLSLLRYRGGIDWGDLGLPDIHDVDKSISAARTALADETTRQSDVEAALEQACRDLQQAHNELLRAQGCPESEWQSRDWPTWTPQANTIRWAEDLLGKELGKRGAQT